MDVYLIPDKREWPTSKPSFLKLGTFEGRNSLPWPTYEYLVSPTLIVLLSIDCKLQYSVTKN
jgi:hypothetical protein